jgi:hypothetical protein
MNQNIWLGLIKIIFDLADPRSKEIGVRQSAIGHPSLTPIGSLVPINAQTAHNAPSLLGGQSVLFELKALSTYSHACLAKYSFCWALGG